MGAYLHSDGIAFYISATDDFMSGVRLGGNLLRPFWSIRNRIGPVNFTIYPYPEYVHGGTTMRFPSAKQVGPKHTSPKWRKDKLANRHDSYTLMGDLDIYKRAR